jgi:NitT/TauT family transport system substrate-binding protein
MKHFALRRHALTRFASLALAALAFGPIGGRAAVAPAPTPVVIAVDGLKLVRNLPILLADRLGYFKAQGLAVTFKETAAEPAIDAQLLDGRIAGMAAYYHHTIVAQMEEGQAMEAVITLAVTPGYQVLVSSRLKDRLSGPSDLKGRRIISGGAHSAKTTSANWLILHAGLTPADYVRLSTGDKTKIAKALKDGTADFVIAPEPDASSYLAQGVAAPFADLYSVAGTRRALGSVFPSAVLYMSPRYVAAHPEVAQALVNALVDTLRYLNRHSVAELRALVPDVVAGEAKEPHVLEAGVQMFATDGRMPPEAAVREAEVISLQFPQYRGVKVDETYTNALVERALQRGPALHGAAHP